MKVITDFVTNSSEADYYDCDCDDCKDCKDCNDCNCECNCDCGDECNCDCYYDCSAKKNYSRKSTRTTRSSYIKPSTDCSFYQENEVRYVSGESSLFPVLTKAKIYSYMTHKYESQKDITYGKAKEYAEDDMIFDLKWNKDCTVFIAKSEGSNDSIYNLRLMFENKTLKGFKCSCPSYSKWHTLCKHLIAMMIVIEKKRKELKASETKRSNGNEALNRLSKSNESSKTEVYNKTSNNESRLSKPVPANKPQSNNHVSGYSYNTNGNTDNNQGKNNQQNNKSGLSDNAIGWIIIIVIYLIVSTILSIGSGDAAFGFLFGIIATIIVLILFRFFS